eukprot:CAMPEP_0172160698 /NCGR_PEP_ID=MMETSP1050-20130122/5705_1 /TAXON_ID=233186 /ORGANISM="Cryptomonas curvata, Strain CCAP979/52" /LENGTH=243 /DNA_ID=CAMNT_0012830495 /DNA_START=247 /DNA_END=975 /DNA_ORIENTATION=+
MQPDGSGDERPIDLNNDLDKSTRFMTSNPIIAWARSLSRFFSSVIAFFCSKYGPIQRFLRGFLLEFKIAKRAWIQEAKRSQEEFRRQRQVDIFESLSGDVDTEDLRKSIFFQGYQANVTETDREASRQGMSIADINEDLWENEEARIEYEQQKQFYSALGILDNVDEDEALLSSEYDKLLSYISVKDEESGEMVRVLCMDSLAAAHRAAKARIWARLREAGGDEAVADLCEELDLDPAQITYP